VDDIHYRKEYQKTLPMFLLLDDIMEHYHVKYRLGFYYKYVSQGKHQRGGRGRGERRERGGREEGEEVERRREEGRRQGALTW
jgi:hypothetical protein